MKPFSVVSLLTIAVAATSIALPIGNLASASAETIPQASTQVGWSTVSSKPGRFSIQMPGTLHQDQGTTSVAGRDLKWIIFKTRQGSDRYTVAYTDLPLGVIRAGRDTLIESLKNPSPSLNLDWTTLASRGQKITLDGNPGMEFLNLDNGTFSTLRLYLVKRRLYAVHGVSKEIQRVTQFVDSFHVESVWQPFVSQSGRFTVRLPMAPIVTSETATVQGKTVPWKKFQARNLTARDDVYVVAYTDLPSNISRSQTEAALEEITTKLLAEVGAPTLSQRGQAIALAGNVGREFMGTTPDGRSVVLRFYLVGNRLYGVFTRSRSLNNLNQFLSSFTVR